jgi:hypothetical protein
MAMNNRQEVSKQRERRCIEVFREVFKEFPDGQVVTDASQERPDVLVVLRLPES